jgi:hypothetical protein
MCEFLLGFAAWQAQQAAVLEAEQRLLSSDLRGPPQAIAVATTPTNKPQQSTPAAVATTPADKPQQTTTPAVASDSLVVEVSNDTTNASSIAVGFKDILKNSISKLIEKIQGQPSPTEIPAVIPKTTPRASDKKQEDSDIRFDFAESEGETFLDQLLRKLSVGKSAVEEEKSSSSDEDGLSKLKSSLFSLGAEEGKSAEDEEEDALRFLLPKKKPSSIGASKKSTAKAAESLEQRIKQLRAENQAAKKQISSILDKVKLSSSDAISDEDRDLYELDLDDSISRGRGRKVGSSSSSKNLIQEELNAAAKESEQLSVDLEALLAELEGQ